MIEKYWSLKFGEDKGQFGRVLRTRDGALEEMTGSGSSEAFEPVRTDEKTGQVFYELDRNNWPGRTGLGETPDTFNVYAASMDRAGIYAGDMGVVSQPSEEAILNPLTMVEAADVLKNGDYVRDMQAMM